MHMADSLLNPAVGAVMYAASTGAMAYAVQAVKKDELSEKKLPMMAVTGAFVFAAQMINFTIPGTGSSGHIGGGILLAALLGRYPALLSVAAVLAIQCLFFADGGLLALGCNIFNLGVIPCLIAYPYVFKPLLHKTGSLGIASVTAAVVGLQIGAFCVVLQTLFSGITELPFTTFALLMQPIHLAIGLVEGVITAAVLGFVHQMRPEILSAAEQREDIGSFVSVKKVVAMLALATVIVGGGLSLFASEYPDGLEWAIENTAGTAELSAEGVVYSLMEEIQNFFAFLPDYDYVSEVGVHIVNGTTLSGIIGAMITCLFIGTAGFALSKAKR